MTDEDRYRIYPEVMKNRDIDPYYFSAPGGESLADVIIRVRVGIIATLYRELPNKTAIVVSHGNVMWPIRIVMEGILPEEYLKLKEKKHPQDKIHNCQILHYSRQDPSTNKVAKKFDWVRSVCPWKPDPKTDNWRPVPHKKYTNQELIKM